MADEQEYEAYPASQEDLERRQEIENQSPLILSTADVELKTRDDTEPRDYTVEGMDEETVEAYSPDVDPQYRHYSDEQFKPYRADGGPEALVEEEALGQQPPADKMPEPEEEEQPPPPPPEEPTP